MSKSYEARVKIEQIGETEEIGTNGFKKREVIGVVEGEYPDHYKFEFIKDKTSLPDELIEGAYATISFNLKGKKVESKKEAGEFNYFTALQAWKISTD